MSRALESTLPWEVVLCEGIAYESMVLGYCRRLFSERLGGFCRCVEVVLTDLKEEERNREARTNFIENSHGSRLSYLPAISCKSRKVVKRLRKGDDTPDLN